MVSTTMHSTVRLKPCIGAQLCKQIRDSALSGAEWLTRLDTCNLMSWASPHARIMTCRLRSTCCNLKYQSRRTI